MVAGTAGVARQAAATKASSAPSRLSRDKSRCVLLLRPPLCAIPPQLRARRVSAPATTNAAQTGSDDVSAAPSSSSLSSAASASSSSDASSSSSSSSRAPRRDWRPNAFQKNDDELHTLLNSISPIERGSVLLARAPSLPLADRRSEEMKEAEEEMERAAASSRRASSAAATTSFSPPSAPAPLPPLLSPSPSPLPAVTSAPPGVSSRPRSPPPEAYGSSPLWTPHPLSEDEDESDGEEGEETVAAAFLTEDDDYDGESEDEVERAPSATATAPSSSPPGPPLTSADGSPPNPQPTKKPPPPRTTTPVYVMLPLDTVWLPDDPLAGGALLTRGAALEAALRALAAAGVTGVAVDVWWGIAEAAGPGQYDFDAYARLFAAAAAAGLKVSATMSFHAAGGNVGDICTVPLPPWVLAAGEGDPEMFYTDAAGHRNRECLSLGADEVECLPAAAAAAAAEEDDQVADGASPSPSAPPQMRTPVRAYSDFVSAFATRFRSALSAGTIAEVTVGLGPAGELRYPSYPEGDGRWRFPGVGAFQCYDSNMKRSLASAALAAGEPAWGHGAPHDAGWYNSTPWDAPFFAEHGRWDSDYGRFFLDWYSSRLVGHADLVLGACREALDAALSGEQGSSAAGAAASVPAASAAFSSSDSDSSPSSSPGLYERMRRRSRDRRPLHRRLLGFVGRGDDEDNENEGGDAAWSSLGWNSDSSGGYSGDDAASPSSILAPYLPASSALRSNVNSSGSRQQRRKRPRLGAKLAGVHWWYGHPSHAAELTAGYYNVYHRDGYLPLLDVLAKHGAAASLTCVEMRDCEHPPHAHCRPQALLDQVVAAASVAGSDSDSDSSSASSSNRRRNSSSRRRRRGGVPLAGENALQRYDDAAASALVERAASLSQLTFLRMGDLMFDNWGAFAALLARLRVRE